LKPCVDPNVISVRAACAVVSRMPSGGDDSSAATQLRSWAAVAPVSAMIT